jgi:hypothetical protein
LAFGPTINDVTKKLAEAISRTDNKSSVLQIKQSITDQWHGSIMSAGDPEIFFKSPAKPTD